MIAAIKARFPEPMLDTEIKRPSSYVFDCPTATVTFDSSVIKGSNTVHTTVTQLW